MIPWNKVAMCIATVGFIASTTTINAAIGVILAKDTLRTLVADMNILEVLVDTQLVGIRATHIGFQVTGLRVDAEDALVTTITGRRFRSVAQHASLLVTRATLVDSIVTVVGTERV